MKTVCSMLTAAVAIIGTIPGTAFATNYKIDPNQPTWVRPLPLPSVDPDANADRRDVQVLLEDIQDRLDNGQHERYYHWAERILSSEGLEVASELSFPFQPTFERLTIHFVRLHRAGEVLDALRDAELRLIQQESELERRIFNGRATVMALLRDVRVGDVVEYAYSNDGSNPLLKDSYATKIWLGEETPVAHLQFRLVWPQERPLHFHTRGLAIEPTVIESGGFEHYVWQRRPATGVPHEDRVPEWHRLEPTLSLSSYGGWADVARWAVPLYRAASRRTKEIRELSQRFSDEPDRAARVLAALRFVQEEIRYLGIEIGASSYQPHDPGLVLERRFGDCKDKVTLLIAILGELGIEALPVLVDSRRGQALNTEIPSVGAFDHVIARVTLDRDYFLDATASHQRGSLAQVEARGLGYGLVVAPDTRSLTELPHETLDESSMSVVEYYSREESDGSGRLRVETTYRGTEATYERLRFARASRESVARTNRDFYARWDSDIESDGDLVVEDDQETNVLRVIERYRIPTLWKEDTREFLAWSIDSALDYPKVLKRSAPFAIEHPVWIEHKIRFETATPWDLKSETDEIEGDALVFTSVTGNRGNTIELDYTLKSRTDRVGPGRIQEHIELLDEVSSASGYHIWRNAGGGVFSARWGYRWAGILAIVLLWGGWQVAGKLRVVWRHRRQRLRHRFDAGESAETAVVVDSVLQAETRLEELRCPCGSQHRLRQRSGAEKVLFGGKTLLTFALECETCGRGTAFFAAVKEARGRNYS